jgi:hypothetical protein
MAWSIQSAKSSEHALRSSKLGLSHLTVAALANLAAKPRWLVKIWIDYILLVGILHQGFSMLLAIVAAYGSMLHTCTE